MCGGDAGRGGGEAGGQGAAPCVRLQRVAGPAASHGARPPRHPPRAPASQAKDLVEGAPCIIMAKVKREDAGKIIEKLKAETGGEFVIE